MPTKLRWPSKSQEQVGQTFKSLSALRLLPKLALFALNAIWAVPAVVLVRVVRPWVHVRMGTFDSSRIGHFVSAAAILLARHSLQSQLEHTIDLLWFPKQTCNEQWARMVRRQLFVRWWVRYLADFNKFIPGGESHYLPVPTLSPSRDIHSIMGQSSARFEFTLEEEETAKAWLRRRGWKDGERFVCVAVRDSAYLSFHPLHSNGGSDRWSYHNYRDSDIDTYVEALQTLVDRGYWVIRMGKIVHKRLPLRHHRVIDYPFVEDKDDTLDIWLCAHCHFFVSTGIGIDTVSWVYGKPVVYVNALPLMIGTAQINHIWVPKHLRWKDSGCPLTLKEHCRHGYTYTTEYERAGIATEDLSSTEITAAVMECEQRVAGIWVETEDDKDRQRRYWEKWPVFHNFHSYIHPEARIGCAWLKSMGDAFLD